MNYFFPPLVSLGGFFFLPGIFTSDRFWRMMGLTSLEFLLILVILTSPSSFFLPTFFTVLRNFVPLFFLFRLPELRQQVQPKDEFKYRSANAPNVYGYVRRFLIRANFVPPQRPLLSPFIPVLSHIFFGCAFGRPLFSFCSPSPGAALDLVALTGAILGPPSGLSAPLIDFPPQILCPPNNRTIQPYDGGKHPRRTVAVPRPPPPRASLRFTFSSFG